MSTQSKKFKEKLRQLRQHYIEQLPGKREAIIATLNAIKSDPGEQKNIEDMRFIAHTLAGSGGSFGLYALSKKARALDMFLKSLPDPSQQVITENDLAELAHLTNELLAVSTDGIDDDILDLAQDIEVDNTAVTERILVIDEDRNVVNVISEASKGTIQWLEPFVGRHTLIETIRKFRPGCIFVTGIAMLEETDAQQVIHALQRTGTDVMFIYLAENEAMASQLIGSADDTSQCLVKPVDVEHICQLLACRENQGLAGEIEPAASVIPSPEEQQPRNATTILYIEDNPVNSKFVNMIVETESDYELVVHDCAESALEYLETSTPDLILLDINLPGMDGYTAYQVIRDRPELAKVPVIALTGNTMQSDKQRAVQAGFDAYLTKPINIGKLLDTINAFILVK
jgi:CheY-like chemotaxis protein/HPt (histidine-containing phosphotransfer) domain-containing protein